MKPEPPTTEISVDAAGTFEHPWPADLPASCPGCGQAFRTRRNLSLGPGRIGRTLRELAWWMVVPSIIGGAALFLLADMPNFGFSGGYAILALMFIPPAAVAVASVFFPLSRRVTCHGCGWRKDFPVGSARASHTASGTLAGSGADSSRRAH